MSFSPGDSGYSEYTPGYDCTIYCEKHQWNFNTLDESTTSAREKFNTANKCEFYKDYREVK